MKEERFRRYDENVGHLLAVKRALEGDLLSHLRAAGMEVSAVLARVKSRDSLRGKLHRPDRTYTSIEQVCDLVGLRVVTYFEDGVLDVAGVVEKNYEIDWNQSVDKGKQLNPSQFGYRSLHYVCRLPPQFEELTGSLRGLKFEIQIRSILQHAWAQMEHDLGYKSKESIPLAFRRRFSRLAGLLEIVDEEFVALRRSLQDYSRDMQAELERVPIDSLSLSSFVHTPQVAEADERVAGWLGAPLGETVFYPEYLTRMLTFIGLRTIGELSESLQRLRGDVEASLPAYFHFAKTTWGLSEKDIKSVERGYCLLFLAHVLLLREDRLEIERIERLTSFYRTLDYPEDPLLARQTALALQQAFQDWL